MKVLLTIMIYLLIGIALYYLAMFLAYKFNKDAGEQIEQARDQVTFYGQYG